MMDRRRFLAAVTVGAPLVEMNAAALSATIESRGLSFTHLHTGEHLGVEYFSAGHYVPQALAAINHLLRDFRSGETGTMNPSLLATSGALFLRGGGVGYYATSNFVHVDTGRVRFW